MNWPGAKKKNSGPNPRSFQYLIWGTLSPRQVGSLLDEILTTCPWGMPHGFDRFTQSQGRMAVTESQMTILVESVVLQNTVSSSLNIRPEFIVARQLVPAGSAEAACCPTLPALRSSADPDE